MVVMSVLHKRCLTCVCLCATVLRCLGVPARVITNFCSAHDNTGNLKTDLIFSPDGTPDHRNTRDSPSSMLSNPQAPLPQKTHILHLAQSVLMSGVNVFVAPLYSD